MSYSDPALNKIAAYGIVLLILYGLSKTGLGYEAIYRALWIILVGLLLINAPRVVAVLRAGSPGA